MTTVPPAEMYMQTRSPATLQVTAPSGDEKGTGRSRIAGDGPQRHMRSAALYPSPRDSSLDGSLPATGSFRHSSVLAIYSIRKMSSVSASARRPLQKGCAACGGCCCDTPRTSAADGDPHASIAPFTNANKRYHPRGRPKWRGKSITHHYAGPLGTPALTACPATRAENMPPTPLDVHRAGEY